MFFAGAKHDARKSGARVFINRFAVRALGVVVRNEPRSEQRVIFGVRNDDVVNPFEEVSAGFIAHAVSELAGE